MSTIGSIQYKYYGGGFSDWTTPGVDDYQYCGSNYGIAYKFSVSGIPAGFKISKLKITGSQLASHNLRADLRTTNPTNNSFYSVGSGGTIATKTMSASTSISITLSDFEITSSGTYYLFLKSTENHTDVMLPKLTITATDTANGTVRIFTSSTASGMYIPYVYDSGWKQCIPYVYDGGWKICGG